EEARGLGRRADEKPVVDPGRVIACGIAPGGRREIARLAGEPRAGHSERSTYHPVERRADVLAGRLFDQSADEKIADIGVRPTLSRIEKQAIGADAPPKLPVTPRQVAARHRLVIR